MAPSTIRKALGAVKDRTSIGLARVSHSAKLSDLDVAIVKATRHDEHPADDKYLREILNLTCYSRAYVGVCVASLSRRLGRTRSWAVALKTLVLVHRLLAEGDPAYEKEIFFATRRGTRMLNVSDFRDTSKSDSWDFSAFVRTYALYLDERLDYRVQGIRKRRRSRSSFDMEEEEEEEAEAAAAVQDEAAADSSKPTPAREMKTEKLFVRTQHLHLLLERFLACRPTGAAKHHRLVVVALVPLVKDSFQIYSDLADIVNIFVDRFMELEVPTCVRVHYMFTRLAKQFDELDSFYGWAKSVGICRSSEYPEIEHITAKKLDVMDEFISDKSALQHRRHEAAAELPGPQAPEELKSADNEDMNQIKALPAPEDDVSEEEPVAEGLAFVENVTTLEETAADLLNLNDDQVMTSEEQGDKLALALFDGNTAAAPPKWDAFSRGGDGGDWESALVTTASNNLSGQRASLGGGLDMMMLDGLYAVGQGQYYAAAVNHATKSASSVAATQAPMLALPAPPTSGAAADPFAASLAVPPPAYVQMTEMEVKQHWLTEEQRLWQRYASEGMKGQAAWSNLQPHYHVHHHHHHHHQEQQQQFIAPGSYQYQQNQYQFNGGYGRMA